MNLFIKIFCYSKNTVTFVPLNERFLKHKPYLISSFIAN